MNFAELNKVSITQGSYGTTIKGDEVFSAVLGSCVAVCAYDPALKFGGMNHILLPGSHDQNQFTKSNMYAVNLMELLFNSLFQLGSAKRSLELKVFGGAKVLNTGTDIGLENANFVMRYVETEGYNVVSTSLGGPLGRRVEFHPASGRSRQKFLSDHPSSSSQNATKQPLQTAGKVELF